MHVTVVFFARLKREMGTEQLGLELPAASTVRELASLLETTHQLSLRGCMVAVNESYAQPEQPLQDGDEVAFLPPVAGGSQSAPDAPETRCEITAEALCLKTASRFLVRPQCGAQAYFVGTVRSPNQGKTVHWIDYEAYPGMAVQIMQEAAANARAKYGELRVFIQHRTGKLLPADESILIGVASPHRRAALEASDFLIEYLKVHIPVWKHECDEEGEHWVTGQTGHETL